MYTRFDMFIHWYILCPIHPSIFTVYAWLDYKLSFNLWTKYMYKNTALWWTKLPLSNKLGVNNTIPNWILNKLYFIWMLFWKSKIVQRVSEISDFLHQVRYLPDKGNHLAPLFIFTGQCIRIGQLEKNLWCNEM